ncbi:hypothetical protein Aph01nite_11210 [Acrocarpospora phusangensis]|uniref:Uncharacterized protein n=2 Tax=Acrocarpospora phusangensis TaxID=1070424 RepID=A0A919Q622_9ACTN|nr:hypothetical protein Aph01nite_11210 [Acrocarpospora phusangensis]
MLLGLISLVVYALAARLRLVNGIPQGDEPHYLIATVALAEYHTFDIGVVYDNRDYLSFFPEEIERHLSPDENGQMLPWHNFGAPLLWVPFFLLWGRAGATGFMVVVAVLTVLHVFWFLRELGIVRLYATLTAGLFAVGTTIYVYSNSLFTESLAALLLLYAMRVICRRDNSSASLCLASMSLGYLPWLNGRFLALALPAALLLLLRVRRSGNGDGIRAYSWAFGPMLLLFGALGALNYLCFNTFHPSPGNGVKGVGPLQISPVRGLAGLLFDREFGLFPNFPVLVFVVIGIGLGIPWVRWQLDAAVGFVAMPYVLATATYSEWWAGFAPPGRYLAVVVPLLAFYVAVTLQRIHHWLAILIAAITGLVGFAFNFATDLYPGDRFHWPTPPNQAMSNLGRLLDLPIAEYLPGLSVSKDDPIPMDEAILTVGWALVIAMLAAAVWIFENAPPERVPPLDLRLFPNPPGRRRTASSPAGPEAVTAERPPASRPPT